MRAYAQREREREMSPKCCLQRKWSPRHNDDIRSNQAEDLHKNRPFVNRHIAMCCFLGHPVEEPRTSGYSCCFTTASKTEKGRIVHLRPRHFGSCFPQDEDTEGESGLLNETSFIQSTGNSFSFQLQSSKQQPTLAAFPRTRSSFSIKWADPNKPI